MCEFGPWLLPFSTDLLAQYKTSLRLCTFSNVIVSNTRLVYSCVCLSAKASSGDGSVDAAVLPLAVYYCA